MLNDTEQNLVLSDTRFGLGNQEGLVWWVTAAKNGNDSVAYLAI